MRDKIVGTIAVCVLSATLGGCAEMTRAAEDAARRSGDERMARAIRGGATLVSGLLPIGYEEESSIGQAISLQVVARYGGVSDQSDLTRYVNLVGRAVASTCDRPEIPYRFAVLKHDSINAFAAPAGYIFVTRGLLKQIQNEAELAAVLGHEIAHVSQKHILQVIQRSKQLAGITEAGLAYTNQNPEAFKGLIDGAVKKLLDEGQAGDNVGLLLRGVDRKDIERGQVIAKPGSIKPHTKFKAEAYVLTKEEGGRHTPFFTGYRPQFYFRTTDVTGVAKLPEGVEMVMPGDNIAMEIELIMPIAMEKGLRFAIREGGRTVGAGTISEIIE